MSFNSVTAGNNLPDDIHAIIEVPANSSPVKYEVDKDMDALVVDRFMPSPMFYPVNYGYIPETLADDGDPIDVLVVTPYPVTPGAVIRCRPVGVLNMTDEKGEDVKLIAVPHESVSSLYKEVHEYSDLPELLLDQIRHFFEHYKELEPGKWVKLESWASARDAKEMIKKAAKAYGE